MAQEGQALMWAIWLILGWTWMMLITWLGEWIGATYPSVEAWSEGYLLQSLEEYPRWAMGWFTAMRWLQLDLGNFTAIVATVYAPVLPALAGAVYLIAKGESHERVGARHEPAQPVGGVLGDGEGATKEGTV